MDDKKKTNGKPLDDDKLEEVAGGREDPFAIGKRKPVRDYSEDKRDN